MVFEWWPSITDVSPALNQHNHKYKANYLSSMMAEWCLNDGPALQTSAQHWTNISGTHNLLNAKLLYTSIQCWPNVFDVVPTLYRCYTLFCLLGVQIVIQIVLYKAKRQYLLTWTVSSYRLLTLHGITDTHWLLNDGPAYKTLVQLWSNVGQ